MPRALTEQEKCVQCERLLDRGRDIVLSQGIRKVSVEEIAHAAGMAKGTFYQHFDSKEQYLFELVWRIHLQLFEKAQRTIQSSTDLKASMRVFLVQLFSMPEIIFFMKNYHEIDVLLNTLPPGDVEASSQRELDIYRGLLALAGIDTERVNPGVVHNYIHSIFMMMSSEMMIKEALPESFERMMDDLISYLFEGTP